MTFILVNVCIPPFTYPSISDLNNLVSNLNKPIIFIGDLNAWSPQWGSKAFNKKGHTVSKLILDNDLVLNNDQPTYFSTHNSFTNVDIILCSSRLCTFISWSISDSLHGSDLFPITTSIFKSYTSNYKNRTIFKTDLANWSKYQLLYPRYKNPILENKNIN